MQHRATLSRQYKGLLCIGVFMALNVSLNNLSLVQISLSLNQVIRASMPVVVAAVAVFVERKVPTRTESVALLLLTAGVIVSIFEGKASGNTAGISLSITGVLCAAAMMSTAGRVLSEKIDVLQLAFYTAPVSSCVLLPFFWFLEKDQFLVYAQENGGAVLAIVLLGSTVALAYNVTHNLLLKRTSSVAVTVLGEVKIVGLLILSAAILPGESSQFTARMTAGCAMAMLGFCLYSNAKIVAARKGSGSSNGGRGVNTDTKGAAQEGRPSDVEEGKPLMQAERPQQQEQAVFQVLGKPGKEHPANAKFWATEGQMRVVANVQASATGNYAPAAAR
ncbi:probable sugar phosphate/phosphate translocator At1g12500 [Coccomyxa sp. Obi]|nr:probable sugar phosphate/phosphate translocator At1g12500 [Coccomyxa sp. Obi]